MINTKTSLAVIALLYGVNATESYSQVEVEDQPNRALTIKETLKTAIADKKAKLALKAEAKGKPNAPGKVVSAAAKSGKLTQEELLTT